MRIECLPIASVYDPAEDPATSVDPVGTAATAEQLAEVLFPGITNRMWRARLITFSALASVIADRVTVSHENARIGQLDARLALERMFVSALARKEPDPDYGKPATRSVPGMRLARRALNKNDAPLGPGNFLKGQATNGPSGVMARLARELRIIDEDDQLDSHGVNLLTAWSSEEQLGHLFSESKSGSNGSGFLQRLRRMVAGHLTNSPAWPSGSWAGWGELASTLRPDRMGPLEQDIVYRRLLDDRSGVRTRCVELLRKDEIIDAARSSGGTSLRGISERDVLLHGFMPRLIQSRSDPDRTIVFTIRLISVFEQLSIHTETAFRSLLWGLVQRGESTLQYLVALPDLSQHLENREASIRAIAPVFQQQLANVPGFPVVEGAVNQDRLREFSEWCLNVGQGAEGFARTLMDRHRDVQKAKSKGTWIDDDGKHWKLMPGFGEELISDWNTESGFLHSYRVRNAISLLMDLGRAPALEVQDEEA